MAQNIFQSEWIYEYRYNKNTNTYPYYGELVERNGAVSMQIGPRPFYNTARTPTYSYVLADKFEAGKRYVFDLWVDTDDVVYNGSNKPAGIIIRYSDDTTTNMHFTGNQNSPLGFQHKIVVTPEGKDVVGFTVHYSTSPPGYYRLDSTITEYDPQSIKKNGIADVGNTKEGDYGNASFVNGGKVYTNGLYET